MVNLPQNQLDLIKSWNVRHCIEINFSNGLKIYPDYIGDDQINLQSDISFQCGVSQQNDYDLGNVIFKTLKFSLSTIDKDYQQYSWNNTTCDVYYLISGYDDETFERIYIGSYIVLAEVLKRTETINIVAYDKLYKAQLVDAQQWFTKNVVFPIKVGDLLTKIANHIGVNINTDNFNGLKNRDVLINEATQLGGKTLRDILGWIGTICCGNVCMCIDYTGDQFIETLKIVELVDTSETLQDETPGLFGELTKSDYETSGYQIVNITVDAYNTKQNVQTGIDGSQYNINGNGILHVSSQSLINILDNVLNTLSTVKYTPYTLPLNMPYFLVYTPGDVVSINFFGEQFISPVTYISCDGILTCNNLNFQFKGSEYKVGDNQQSQNIQNAVTSQVTDIPNAIINTEDTVNNRLETKWIYGDEDVNIDIVAYFDDNMYTKKLYINGKEIPVTNTEGTVS